MRSRYQTESRLKDDGRFYWENPSDYENVVVAFVNKAKGLTIAVSNEEPVDSYNVVFEMTASLDVEGAKRLRDYLIANLSD